MVYLQPKVKGEDFINIIKVKDSNYGSHLTSIPSICVNIKFMDANPTYTCSVWDSNPLS